MPSPPAPPMNGPTPAGHWLRPRACFPSVVPASSASPPGARSRVSGSNTEDVLRCHDDDSATLFCPVKKGRNKHRVLIMSPEQPARMREAIVQLSVEPPAPRNQGLCRIETASEPWGAWNPRLLIGRCVESSGPVLTGFPPWGRCLSCSPP